MSESLLLEGKVAVVTGAGRGIGLEIARHLALAGTRVAQASRSGAQLETAAAELREAGATALAVPTDVTDPAAVDQLVRRVETELGPVDLLVNNAGSFYAIGPVWEVDPERWWTDVTINLRGPFLCCRAVLPGMIARGAGRVINLIGGGTGTPFAHGSGYASSKAGVMRLTETIAEELRLRGSPVAVFALGPGLVRTTLTEYQLHSPEGKQWMPRIEAMFEEGKDVPPSQAAELAVRLASGRFDVLAGRAFSINDDLDDLLAREREIRGKDLKTLRFRI